MMYPFMTFKDKTEIVHSEILKSGEVKVYIEKPDVKDGFHYATCYLPGYRWEDVYRFSAEEVRYFQALLESAENQIIRLAKKESR